tara:strand:- start:47 stop:244 length:198 start_codon:yes stop_codon:yes gene_type:complete
LITLSNQRAGLAQVAFGQTGTFHLWTWLERPTFNREVRGSSPRVGNSASENARGARLSSISPIAT